jgi:transcriptional regulator with XRE-family HTH domain
MEKLQKNFGNRLKQLRKAKKLTQEQLASKAKMDWKYYGMIERGELNSTLETIDRLSTAFEVEVYQLFVFAFKDMLTEAEIIDKEFNFILSTADEKARKKIFKIAQLILS